MREIWRDLGDSLQLLGSGGFGCVLSAPVPNPELWSKYGERLALKMVISRASEINEFRYGFLVTKKGKMLEFFVKTFDAFRIFVVEIDDPSRDRIPFHDCIAFSDNFKKAHREKDVYLHVIELESLSGVTLHDYSRIVERRLDSSVINYIVSQITHAISYLHDECDILHRDLKNSNILLTIRKPNEEVTISYPIVKKLPFMNEFPFYVKISDFVLSLQRNDVHIRTESVFGNVRYSPVTYLFFANIPEDDNRLFQLLNADNWCIGMLWINLLLAHWECETITGETELYHAESVFSLKPNLGIEALRIQLSTIIKKESLSSSRSVEAVPGYGSVRKPESDDSEYAEGEESEGEDNQESSPPPSSLPEYENSSELRKTAADALLTATKNERRILVLLFVCQFQYYLGNGFVPNASIFTERWNVSLNAIFEELSILSFQDKIRQACNISNGKNFFQNVIEEINRRIGEVGMDYLRRLMSWYPPDEQLLEQFYEYLDNSDGI